MADYLNIAGRIRTTASDGVAMEAQEVKDLNLNKSQQEVNADVQTELGDRYTKEETYNKEQLNNLITTPDASYVNVVATSATTAVTDVLPAEGAADTIYRVGNWDGTQYDPTMYALYAWNGSAYVCVAVRSFVGEVYDVSVNHPDGQGNPTAYADLTAALGVDGANIPADIRRGGMSIKFIQGTVQSSDNKYIQARCMAQNFTTDVTQWQGVDDEPSAGSNNLVKSGGVAECLSLIQNELDKKVENEKYITNDILNIGNYIKELYIEGMEPNTTYIIRNFQIRENDIVFAIGTSGGYWLGYNFDKNTELQSYSRIKIIFSNLEINNTPVVNSNTDATKYVINKNKVENIAYSPTINLNSVNSYRDRFLLTELICRDKLQTYDIAGYLQGNGSISYTTAYKGKVTDIIPCSEGDVFLYKGYGKSYAVSVLYYGNSGIMSSDKYESNDSYTEITVPSNITKIQFASYAAASANVILDVKVKSYPGIEPTISQIQKEIDDMIGGTVKLRNKKVTFDGDSICEGQGVSNRGGYGKIIADRNSMIYTNNGVGGGTITKYTAYYFAWKNGSDIYYTNIFRPIPGTTKAYDSHTSQGPSGNEYNITAYDSTNNAITIGGIVYTYSQPDSKLRHWICESVESIALDAEYIIFEGGLNDFSNRVEIGTLSDGFDAELNEETFFGAFESTIKKLFINHASAKIGYVSVHHANAGWKIGATYHDAAIECCKKWGVPYIELVDKVPPFPYFPSGSSLRQNVTDVYTYNGDGIHPNISGYERFYCNLIEEWMKTL